MPEISANMIEAVLSEWPVAENVAFKAGDAIATVETDKAVVDVPADADGVLVRFLVEPGKAVSVGTPMAVLAAPGEVIADVDELVGRLVGGAPAAADEPTPAGAREVTQNAEPAATAPARVFASPLARRLARDNDVRVEDLRGTGPNGRIVRDDVHQVLAARRAAPTAPAIAAPANPASVPEPANPTAGPASPVTPAEVSPVADGASPTAAGPATAATPVRAAGPAGSGVRTASGYDEIPHTRMRRAIATRLSEAARETPVFSIRGSARVDELLALRSQLNSGAGVKISVNDLIVAAAARTHAAIPDMNVVWTEGAVRRFHDVDLSVAVATEHGLVTPVVRGAQRLTVSALAGVSADLVGRARDGKLRQDELEGGTLTVTNLGVYGTEEFSAVINPPQAAILAVGAARPEAVVTDGVPAVATVLRVTLSVDHRPVDGALAARWMAHFLGLLEAPIRILV
ncbi:2-oxo acid dehydrogenase subunit E2 [Actinoplanes bogorensis]|uniref:Dihydrolipoamide acetyltransferase component of pyruvate dehydrogenase complex n=1 Tax=Paractinoplanes bogorensis TaxID=1610840 RepID=A0ABS5Z3T0_9ACTN|nr:dihydrolipoamide acetyltransferase family protein [Actinoplanes bogorensis]MBU2670342.1 2-oxo acid dehydrogenase subunit E2 [Actinoplanes bogorensis]